MRKSEITMQRCLKCGRAHRGICGIPAGLPKQTGVTLGFGARIGGQGIGGLDRGEATLKKITRQRATPKETALRSKGRQRLEGLVEWGEHERQKVLELLKVLPPEMEEYTQLAERLDKLEHVLSQVKLQLGR